MLCGEKSEIRSPKSETNSKSEKDIRNRFLHSIFGFVSDFGFRISNFRFVSFAAVMLLVAGCNRQDTECLTRIGRKLGIPTANVELGEYVVPKFGVYATLTRLKDGRHLPGVANIGVNPTTGEVAPRLEVWLFDFDEDIYGETIRIEFIKRLRGEKRFDSVDGLVGQMHSDVADARQILGC